MPVPIVLSPWRLSLGLFEIATGLRSDTAEVFDLTAASVCKNALRMVQRRSPFLGKMIATLVPLAFLGYGTFNYIWMPLKMRAALDSLYPRLFAEVRVQGSDPVNRQVLGWMADQGTAMAARSITLFQESRHARPPDSAFRYVSSAQTCWFKHDGRWLCFEQRDDVDHAKDIDRTARDPPSVVISCFSLTGDSSPVRDFLNHVKKKNHAANFHTSIYHTPASAIVASSWGVATSRPIRKLNTVAMEAEVKDAIIASVEDYLSPVTRKWYYQRGLPLRKGILLYGPPGTGKTSFSTALAGHFNLNIYILSFSTIEMDDGTLTELFSLLPPRCVVLLEDVDSAGIRRENIATLGSSTELMKKSVTMSGLLNVIDGAGAAEGRILVMTSNSANTLDPALVRPGRIDHKILMGNASPEVAKSLWMQIYSEVGFVDDELNDCHQEVSRQADIFASRIPLNALSPAEIQNFLLMHRDEPGQALAQSADWADRLVALKASGRNVEDSHSFDSKGTAR